MEERLVDIEIRITHQEDLLDTLNQAVYRQQQQLDQLQALCAGLAQRLKEPCNRGAVLLAMALFLFFVFFPCPLLTSRPMLWRSSSI